MPEKPLPTHGRMKTEGKQIVVYLTRMGEGDVPDSVLREAHVL
jgi:hypothetical protein